MRRIAQESTRLKGLVEDLMLLARLDEGPAEPSVAGGSHHDCRGCGRGCFGNAPSRIITVKAPGSVVVPGVEDELRQVDANLVTNALVHSGPSAEVCIRIERRDDVAIVSVIDDGAGISTEHAARAFDRFCRLDDG